MKKFILFLFFLPLGCSIESSAIEDVPNIEKSETTFVESSIEDNCTGEPLLSMYEEFVKLGIKESNLLTSKANITFTKSSTPKSKIENNLTSDFGANFLKNACSIDGTVISIKDLREGYLGAYQITYNSEESALLAANIIRDTNSTQLKFFKVATVFDWRLIKNTILINYNSPATTVYYEHNVNAFSK
ncbi:hypothetical protein [Psychrobacter fozii]|uniref:hypothetical protein n=1 Tax=Psychrobacter fozii TaxID=198480 RepID=UPI00191B60BB|nr:hypothetical protein [Psychrobacter fozii]